MAAPNRNFLKEPVEFLKGVGSARADILKKELHIFTCEDLLFHYPFRHVDRTRFYSIAEMSEELPLVQLKGQFTEIRVEKMKKGQRLKAVFTDGRGTMEVTWFQGLKWLKESLKTNTEYILFGKPSVFNGRFNMVHPSVDLYNEENIRLLSSLVPVYSVTERMKERGMDSRLLMKLQHNLLQDERVQLAENLPDFLLQQEQLCGRLQAIRQMHFPKNPEELSKAVYRLKLEELFFLQLKILRYKLKRTQLYNGISFAQVGRHFNYFYEYRLPFELTEAQKKVIKEIRADMKSGRQMNRLLQGDVGSGKTVVALMCMLIAIDNQYQTCLMAPTEILAAQHYQGISQLLGDMELKVALLTGSTGSRERKEILAQLEAGELHLLIGTHALLEDDVKFKQLGLVIIDEQHRFGVEQRSRLWRKNVHPPHVLVMTATPIPRTLAMTIYGDLDLSVIDQLPAGRKPIVTVHRTESARLAVFGFMKEEIKKGRQVYIVYPLIEESEKMDYMNLQEGYESISRAFPLPEYKVSIVHGRMKAADKDFEMARFVKGETNIMVATTVIEVGVNVPNASVMLIESAERFGLSQLHQLRGRVGRGAEQSYCILMSGNKLSAEARKRLKTMEESNDGFIIAETDLKLRGPGDLEGTQQSGLLDLRLADLRADDAILEKARAAATQLLNDDPALARASHAGTLEYLKQSQKQKVWARIS